VDGSAIDHRGILSISLGQEDEERVLPSHLLSDNRWVGLVVDLLDLKIMNITTNITCQQKEKADHLVKILQNRFEQHLVHRSKAKSNVRTGLCNLHQITLLLVLHVWY
jgi:hypothetical protein